MATAVLFNVYQFGNATLTGANDSGSIETYAAGTTDNQATYKDNTQAEAHTTPILLDANGMPPGGSIWLDSGLSYKFVIKDSSGGVINTIDNIEPGGSTFTAGITMGGNLDMDAYNIVTSNNQDIDIIPDGIGVTNIKNAVFNGSFTLSATLDLNGYDLIVDDGQSILDENSNEQFTFNTTSSAVNNFSTTNAATGNSPLSSVEGDDTNINYRISAKGSGTIELESPTAVSSLLEVDGTSTSSAEVRLYEDTDNGSNYIGLKSPTSVGSSSTFTLPSSDGTSGQILSTDGSKNLSFTNLGARHVNGASITTASSITISGLAALVDPADDETLILSGSLGAFSSACNLDFTFTDDNSDSLGSDTILNYYDGTSQDFVTTPNRLFDAASIGGQLTFDLKLIRSGISGNTMYQVLGSVYSIGTVDAVGTFAQQVNPGAGDKLDTITITASAGTMSGKMQLHALKNS